MAERLIRILAFLNVADGATVALPHGINVAGTATRPDLLVMDAGGFSATADATNVSVTNNSGDIASVNVWAQLVHSEPREIGAIPLVPSPFVAATGGGSAGGVRMWSIPDTGPIALTGGQPISTFAFTPVLGKRYVFQTWFTVTAQADNPSVPIQIGGQLVQDPGSKAAVGFGIGETIAAAEEDQDVEMCVSFQGSIIGDGLPHTYGTVMLFPGGGSTFATRSGLGSSGITVFEDTDRVPA